MIHLNRPRLARLFGALIAAAALSWGTAAQAHCDTLDGPVVGDARKALDSGNVNLVLGWVQPKDEAEIRSAFQKSVTVRKAGGPARELADYAFLETLVRVHRAGEGAPYTGLKPAGQIEPAVAAADKAIETGKLKPVAAMIGESVEHGLHRQFEVVLRTKKHDPNDVQAARAHVGAYVEYVHYVERLHDAARTGDSHAAAGAPAAAAATAHKH
ncbi:DUF6448 family protein [Ramlibacter sp. AN1133]|uniref:DUF6448 family protein n=1 Tax=Ramlibacter sp. AN1133 TaxID=3133429 RepID=UPI0030C196BE